MAGLLSRSDIICDSCGNEFTLITKSEEEPLFCPFCGELMHSDIEEEKEDSY